jgi:hypothetical protein
MSRLHWRRAASPTSIDESGTDYLYWVDSVPSVRRWHDALAAAGADVEWIDLPAQGIQGNSHALMADDNSDAIAMIVLDWLRRHGLAA